MRDKIISKILAILVVVVIITSCIAPCIADNHSTNNASPYRTEAFNTATIPAPLPFYVKQFLLDANAYTHARFHYPKQFDHEVPTHEDGFFDPLFAENEDFNYTEDPFRISLDKNLYPPFPIVSTENASQQTSGKFDQNASHSNFSLSSNTYYVPDDYPTIQEAVDAANPGDTIIVKSGTYYENVNVNKRLTLRGIDIGDGKPVVDAGGNGSAITLSSDGVKLEGFKATNSGDDWQQDAGIKVAANNNTITDNTVYNNIYGIFLWSSNENIITGNTASNNKGCGIYLRSSCNNTIIGNNASNNEDGIYIYSSDNNNLTGNTVNSNNYDAFLLYSSDNNTIINNTVNNNAELGIYLLDSSNNILIENTANNNCNGILLQTHNSNSSNNTLKNNRMSGNRYNFGAWGSCINNIDITNLVNGKPIYYLIGASGTIIDLSSNAGTVYCFNCKNITVKDQTLTNNIHGIYLYNTSNSRIKNNHISNNSIGIGLSYSSNNTITYNNASNNGYGFVHTFLFSGDGISLGHSNNNTVTNNIVSNNHDNGIDLYLSESNTITGNTVTNNEDSGIYLSGSDSNNIIRNNLSNNKNDVPGYGNGIHLWGSHSNIITRNTISNNSNAGIVFRYSCHNINYLNNFINEYNVFGGHASNMFNSTEHITYKYHGSAFTNYMGNYWGDYTGIDANNDGIGDTPYVLPYGNSDNYPLMEPFENYFAPTELEVDIWISINGVLDKRSELEYYIGNQLEVHAHVYDGATGSIKGCDVQGELWQNETVYHRFELYDDGKSTHADFHHDDGIYSSKIIVPQLKPGNCTLRIIAKKDGLGGYNELIFENLGYPDGVLNVSLSIIDTTPPDLFKEDTVIFQANVTGFKDNPYLNATVNATVILPTFDQQNLGMAHIGNGTYQCSYVPEMEGKYIVDVFASVNNTVDSKLIGGYAEKRMDVLNGSLFISCPSPGSYFVGEEISLSVNISSDGYPVDGCLVESCIESANVSDKVILHGSDMSGNYIGTYIPAMNGSYTVRFNATHPFYKRTNCSTSFEVFAGPPVKLNETLHDFASGSKKCLDRILGEMGRSTCEGDDFMAFKSRDEAKLAIDVIFDVLLPIHSFKPGNIDDIIYALEYLDQGTAEVYVTWWAAKKLFKKPLGKEIVSAYLSKAVEDYSFRGYYTLQQEVTERYKNEIDSTVNSIVIPAMDVPKQEMFIKDVQMRDHANHVLVTKCIMDGLPLHGLHTKRVIESQRDYGIIDTLFWTTGLILVCGIGDGPGLFFVACYGAYTGGKLVNDMMKLDEDQKVLSLTESLMFTYPAVSWQIYENTKRGIAQVKGEPRLPMGEIVSVQQVSQGHKTLVWWSEDKGYFNVKVKNTGDTEEFFKAVAIYWDDHGQAHWQDATTEDFRGVQIGPGLTDDLNIYWHYENMDIRPKVGDNVLLLLFAYTKDGIYVLDAKSFDFTPVEVDTSASTAFMSKDLMADDKGLAFSNPINVFAASEINSTNYTVVIDLKNPLPVAIAANISQQIADNVTIISCNGSIDNDTIQWFRQISPHDHIRLNYTLLPIGEVGKSIIIPPASFSFYSPQHNETACFTSYSTNITVKPPLYGYGSADRYIYNATTNYMNISLTNFGQMNIDTNITIKLTDINNTIKFNKSYNVTIPANSTQNYNLTFTPILDYESLVREIDTYYNGFKISLVRDCVIVAPFTTSDIGVISIVTVEDPNYIGAFLPHGYDYNNSIVLTVDIVDLTPDNLTDAAYSDITIKVGELDIETCKVFKTGIGFLPEVDDVTTRPTVSGEPAFSRDLVNNTITVRLYVGDPLLGVIPPAVPSAFDTGKGTYPSIMGTHKGEIKPSCNITVSKLYTYPCPGTGGHTESIELYENGTLIANGTWNGYAGDWHNITLHNVSGAPYVRLLKGHRYNYTIVTGSYPQIIHKHEYDKATGGTITCTSFIDANGKTYTDWIPAIKLE